MNPWPQSSCRTVATLSSLFGGVDWYVWHRTLGRPSLVLQVILRFTGGSGRFRARSATICGLRDGSMVIECHNWRAGRRRQAERSVRGSIQWWSSLRSRAGTVSSGVLHRAKPGYRLSSSSLLSGSFFGPRMISMMPERSPIWYPHCFCEIFIMHGLIPHAVPTIHHVDHNDVLFIPLCDMFPNEEQKQILQNNLRRKIKQFLLVHLG